jgi:hypothetical protein
MMPLMSFERRWLRAILDTIFPGKERGVLPLGATDLDVDGFFDGLFAQAPFESSLGLRVAIWILGLAPLFVLGKPRSFAGLGIEDRERLYLKLAASRVYVVRSLVIALKAIGSLLYCGDPTVRGRILAPVPEKAQLTQIRTVPKSPAQNEKAGARHESRSFA